MEPVTSRIIAMTHQMALLNCARVGEVCYTWLPYVTLSIQSITEQMN